MAVLALVAVALVLIGLASVAAVDGLLVGRLDGELQQEARRSAGGPPPGMRGGPGPGQGAAQPLSGPVPGRRRPSASRS